MLTLSHSFSRRWGHHAARVGLEYEVSRTYNDEGYPGGAGTHRLVARAHVGRYTDSLLLLRLGDADFSHLNQFIFGTYDASGRFTEVSRDFYDKFTVDPNLRTPTSTNGSPASTGKRDAVSPFRPTTSIEALKSSWRRFNRGSSGRR